MYTVNSLLTHHLWFRSKCLTGDGRLPEKIKKTPGKRNESTNDNCYIAGKFLQVDALSLVTLRSHEI